jgi:hypothetical protein
MPTSQNPMMATGAEATGRNTVAMARPNPTACRRTIHARWKPPTSRNSSRYRCWGAAAIVAHQRVLFTLLALALVVLGSVVVAVRQADTVAQQVAGTGQSLMQSQRLAKSVSQALVGSAQAFPT